jgi:hypothetical protein
MAKIKISGGRPDAGKLAMAPQPENRLNAVVRR